MRRGREMPDDILSLTAGELVTHYRSKRLSPWEVTRSALDRIARLDPIYNASSWSTKHAR